MTSLKKRILLAALSLLLLAPQSAFATVDVTNYSFEDYENKIGNLKDHYRRENEFFYRYFDDFTLGLIYPLVKDEAFENTRLACYGTKSKEEMKNEGNLNCLEQVIHFSLENSKKKYIALRTRKPDSELTYKIYGRTGNEGKCFLEVSHPDYRGLEYSDAVCNIFTQDGVDYIDILFYNREDPEGQGEKNISFRDKKHYKITEKGAEEVSEIPKKAKKYEFQIVREDEDIVDGFPAHYEMSNEDFAENKYIFSNTYFNYYQDMKSHDMGEYDKFFKGVNEDSMNILKQSMLPLLSRSELSDNGPIDSPDILYFIFQAGLSQIGQLHYYNNDTLPGYLFGKKDIYQPIKAAILKDKNRMYNNNENIHIYGLDMTPFNEFLKRYYKSKISEEALSNKSGQINDEGDTISWEATEHWLNLETKLLNYYTSTFDEDYGDYNIYYDEFKDYADVMSISEVETYQSFASMRVDILKDEGNISGTKYDLEEEAKDTSTVSIADSNWPTDNETFKKKHLTKYLIVEKDPKNEKLPFKIVYSTVYPIDKTILKKIVKSDFKPIYEVEEKYKQINYSEENNKPISEKVISERAEEVKADNNKALMIKYAGIGGVTLGLLALLFFLKKKGGSKAILNNIEKAKKDREESKKIKEKIKAEQQRAREAEEQAKKEKAQADEQVNKQEDKTEVKYCQNCGAKLQANDKFCISCGTKIDRDR